MGVVDLDLMEQAFAAGRNEFADDLDKHGQICMKVGIAKGKRIAASEVGEIACDLVTECVNLSVWESVRLALKIKQAIDEKFGLEI